MTSMKMGRMNRGGDPWSEQEPYWRAPLVCNRCGKLMSDYEPASPRGEFYHRPRPGIVCTNDRKTFYLDQKTQLPELPNEVALFERKRIRRANKRAMRRQRRARVYTKAV